MSMVSTSWFEGHSVVRVEGELDHLCVDELRTAVRATPHAADVLIDLTGLASIDNIGLGAVLGGVREVREHGGHASICVASPAVRLALGATGVSQLADVL